jgi:hypothetical protein
VGEKPNRAIEIAPGGRTRFVAFFALEQVRAGRLDFGSDRCAQTQEQRQYD